MQHRPSHSAQEALYRGLCTAVLAGISCSALPVWAADGEPAGLTAAQRQALPRHFGFGPLEIFKLDDGIDQLRTADFNGDGLIDLALINNKKSTIEVLLQRAETPDQPEQPSGPNDLVNDWRFERKRASVNWEVECLRTGEVTGDNHADLVFFGTPKEVVVLPGRGDGTFADPITRRVRDGLDLPACLDLGDLNSDGRTDVALLAESDVVILLQSPDGGLDNPRRFAHALDSPAGLGLVDLDGDGRDDLVLITTDAEAPMLVRYQNARGELGPFERIKIPELRSLTFDPCLNRPQCDLFGVERTSGRLKRWHFERGGKDHPDREWAVRFLPIPGRSEPEHLPLTIGDVTGNGLPDLVTADVDAAKLVLFGQHDELGLAVPQTFGGQVKMRDMRSFDTDGDHQPELYILSAEEELLARSSYKGQRLTFPKALPTVGKPFALDVGPLTANGDATLVYVSRDEDSVYHLILQPAGATEPGEHRQVEIEELDEPPTAVRLADVNRDGRADVLIFTEYSPLIALLQTEDGGFKQLGQSSSAQRGFVKQATIQGFDFADTDGDGRPEVLLAQSAFVRALCVNADGAWEILDQYHAPGSDVEITGVTTYTVPGSARMHLAMYDRRGREIHCYAPGESGTYKLDRSVEVGTFDLNAMLAAPLNGRGPDTGDALLLADDRRLAVILPGVPATRVSESGVYETSIKDGWLTRIAIGDLNHDDRTDLAVVEIKDHFVEILTFGPDEELIRGNKFRVFAKRQYQSRGYDAEEPHWIEIADVTNDNRDDLILISHDRVLLYPGQ